MKNPYELQVELANLADKILPKMKAVHQPVYTHIFLRSIAVGKDTCSLSYGMLSKLTHLSVTSIKNTLKDFLDVGLIVVTGDSAPKKAKVYRVIWPVDLRTLTALTGESQVEASLKRNPIEDLDFAPYSGILDKLNKDDQFMLQLALKKMEGTEEERAIKDNLRQMLTEPDDIDVRYQEVVVMLKFGPHRLSRYLDNSNA